MIASVALTNVKNLLDIDISITTFDNNINSFVGLAVNRLFPQAQREVQAQDATFSAVTAGRAEVDLSALTTPLNAVRFLELSVDGSTFTDHDDSIQHGNILYIDNVRGATRVRLYGLAAHTITSVPLELELAVVYYAVADFYRYLIGNKRKFNIYSQASGARAADDMRDQADYYENLAKDYLLNHSTMYGGS